MKPKKNDSQLDHYILLAAKEGMPEDLNELVRLVKVKYDLPERQILKRILDLESAGKLSIKKPLPSPLYALKRHVLSRQSSWYWATLILALSATLSTFAIAENAYPTVYARYVLGTILIWLLPGYSCIKLLFPSNVPIPTSRNELDLIERVALSIGMSIVIVILVGFILNYTAYGIRTDSSVLSLLEVTVILATAAIIREHWITRKRMLSASLP